MEIIPAIDIIEGRCVRLKRGNFSDKTVYNDDPVEVAMMFCDNGFNRLHLVDLDGAKAGKVVNNMILERIFNKTRLVIDFGGGIKSDTDIELVFRCGAAMITAGSIAVKDPARVARWINKYGQDKIILGADVNNGKIVVDAWQTVTVYDLYTFIEGFINKGVQKVMCTDVCRDGMMQGPDIELYRQLRVQFSNIFLIASGGISSLADLEELSKIGIDGAIIGKAIYEQTIGLKELQKFIK
jgi:phosphoribosylformimino-5-aminoimidazole carboxamide ribotide isomerase